MSNSHEQRILSLNRSIASLLPQEPLYPFHEDQHEYMADQEILVCIVSPFRSTLQWSWFAHQLAQICKYTVEEQNPQAQTKNKRLCVVPTKKAVISNLSCFALFLSPLTRQVLLLLSIRGILYSIFRPLINLSKACFTKRLSIASMGDCALGAKSRNKSRSTCSLGKPL